jgi:hypothetical protein
MYLQKEISRKTFFKYVFVGILKVNDKRAGSGSISQRHGSADPDPDPHQNVMDPQHWLDPVVMYSTVGLRRYRENHPS